MALNKTYIQKLKKELHDNDLMRRDIIKHASEGLHHAKRAIFAFQRGDMKQGEQKLKESLKEFIGLRKRHKNHKRMEQEGSYRAGLEEYVEAMLFSKFLHKKEIGKITTIPISTEVYLAGLEDVPGELYRYAIRAATSGDKQTVERCEEASAEMIAQMIEFNATKYLRTKFDQAKGAHQKLEIILYELAIRE